MSLTTVVKERIAQGEKAPAGTYIHLVGKKDDVKELWEAYLSIQDEMYTPEEDQGELTEEQYAHYVRLVHDAIRSTDKADDAFQKDNNGNATEKQTAMMDFIDSVGMLEVQLIAGKLVTAVHNVQSGKMSVPGWPMLAGLRLHMFKTFRERMEKVIEVLTLWKAICKDLFYTEVTWEKRIAMQPQEEADKKGTNAALNLRRKLEKQEARKLIEENKKREAAELESDNTDNDKEDNDNQKGGSSEATPAPSKSGNKRAKRIKPDQFIAITSKARRGKKTKAAGSAEKAADTDAASKPADPAAQASTNTDGSTQPSDVAASTTTSGGGPIQPASPAASVTVNGDDSTQIAESPAPASNNAGGATKPSSGTAFVPINAGRSSQHTLPSTPTPEKTGGSNQSNNIFAGPALVDHGPALQAALTAAPKAKGELYDTSKFPGPLARPVAQYGNERPPAYSPGQHSLPKQPQKAHLSGQYFPQQYQPPFNYMSNQQDSYGFQQNTPQSYGFPQPSQQFQMQGAQPSIAQVPPPGQIYQHDQVSGIQFNGQAAPLHHVGQAAGFRPNGRVASIQQHGPMASIQRNNGRIARIRLNGPHSYVVNNYYQHSVPGSSANRALPITQGADSTYIGNEQAMYYNRTVGNDQDLNNDQAIGYAKVLGDDQSEDKCQDSRTEAPTTPTSPQRNWSAAPTEVGEDDTSVVTTTVTPFVESPPYREDDSDPDVAEMHRINVVSGIVPTKGGNVYTGKVSMFESSDDDQNAIDYQMMRDSGNEEEEEDDDEDEFDDFLDV